MADGGGINIRLSLKGAEQVRAELAKIGPSGSQMARELDRALRQPSAGLKAIDTSAREARTGLEQFAGRAGPVGNVLQSFGPWGLAAAAGFAAVAVAAASALQIASQATQAAAAITDTADRIGIGTETLQQWRFVADEAGIPVQALEADLEKLNGVLGKFKMGIGDAKLKPWFQELGISKADLDSIQTADQLMMLLADRLGQITDRSKQVAGARAFGIEASLPGLRLGSEGIQELLDRSIQLGVVMDDEVVRKLDAADRKAELAGQQLKTLAFSAVEPLATALANAGAWLGNMSVEFSRIESSTPGWVQALLQIGRALPGSGAFQRVGELVMARAAGGRTSGRATETTAAGEWNRADVERGLDAIAKGDGTRSGFDTLGHTGGGGGGGVNKAEQERQRRVREAERAVENLQREDFDAQREWLREVQAGRDTASDRAQAARLLLHLDQEEARLATEKVKETITAGGLMTDEVRARLERLDILRADVDAVRQQAIAEKEARELADAVREGQQALADIQFDILSLASDDASTAAERRDIELQLLDLAQRRQRADLEAAIEAEKEPAKRALLNQALTNLPVLFDAQRNRVRQDNAGPLESWWTKQGKNDASANEWIQGQALDAVDGMDRGLIDAIRNSKGAGQASKAMGDVAANAMQKVVDGLLEIALQRMLIQPLAGALFGGPGASGGGGLLGGFLGSAVGAIFGGSAAPKVGDTGGLLPGRLMAGKARGGVQGARGLVPVGEYGLEVIDMPAGSRVYDVERTERMIRNGAMGGRSGPGHGGSPTVNMPIRIVNNGSERMTATTRQTPEGIDVILNPMIDARIKENGANGNLAKAHAMTPKGITR